MTQKLYETAKEAAKNAFAPFSNFHVGAALLASDGRIFT
ncbi:MAG: cytidine deaminase, partial [Firmicutes bacterium]|nr:cytidine deaminase [Bacillota bacterium]